MAGHVSRDFAADGSSQQIKIPDNVKNFMTRQFLRKAQVRVYDFLIIDQDTITKLASVDQAELLHLLHIAQKTEGPCRRNFFFERSRTLMCEYVFLHADRFRILQNVVDRKRLRWFNTNPFSSVVTDAIRTINDDSRPAFVLLVQPSFLDEFAKLRRRSIQDRNLALNFH